MVENLNTSVLICTFNMSVTLPTTVQSVSKLLNQNSEFIIIDDGSTDDTRAVVEHLQSTISQRIKYIRLEGDKRRLLGKTRNIAIENASFETLAMQVDADDIYIDPEDFQNKNIMKLQSIYNYASAISGQPIFLKGPNINFTSKSCMKLTAGYKNIARGEDRDLWRRLNTLGNFYYIHCDTFSYRSSRAIKRPVTKIIQQLIQSAYGDVLSGLHLRDNIRQLYAKQGFIVSVVYLASYLTFRALGFNRSGFTFNSTSHVAPPERCIKLFDENQNITTQINKAVWFQIGSGRLVDVCK
jgi:glycosyltransferase involved in cell wall biosynthesis